MMDQLKAEQDYAQSIGLKLPWSAGQVDAAAYAADGAAHGDATDGDSIGDAGGGENGGSNEEGGQ